MSGFWFHCFAMKPLGKKKKKDSPISDGRSDVVCVCGLSLIELVVVFAVTSALSSAPTFKCGCTCCVTPVPFPFRLCAVLEEEHLLKPFHICVPCHSKPYLSS